MSEDKLKEVFDQIDAINSKDPNMEFDDGSQHPKELLYGHRMTEMLHRFTEPSELLSIAARGQHIKRWAIPRSDFPMDRKGYLKWRTQLKIMHGDLISEIMSGLGYDDEKIKYVADLLMKKNLKKNEDAQTLEDVICLVFLQYYIDDFTRDKPEDKLIDILQKTWVKMSEQGQNHALKLNLSTSTQDLVQKALSEQ